MSNPHQTNSVEEVVEEFKETFAIKTGFSMYGSMTPANTGTAIENFLREKLTTLVSDAKREGRMDTLQEIFIKYGFDFTEEGVKKSLTNNH